jgi:hypothetical protein
MTTSAASSSPAQQRTSRPTSASGAGRDDRIGKGKKGSREVKLSKAGGGGGSSPSAGGAAACLASLFVVAFLVFHVVTVSLVDPEQAAAASSRSSRTLKLGGGGVGVAHPPKSPPHLFQYNVSGVRQGLRTAVERERAQLYKSLRRLRKNFGEGNALPARLRALRENHAVVGERLGEVRAGTETVEEVRAGLD